MRKLRISFSLAIMMLLVGLFSISAFAADPKAPTADVNTTESLSNTQVSTDADNDNGYTNANDTGAGVGGQTQDQSVIKSQHMVKNNGTTDQTQRTHGEYQNNTNSCASCHQTHTGSAKNLLMKDGVYATCTACHDGTLGFYNVFEGSTAGTFGAATPDHDGSIHMANESLTVSAAPGGDRTGTDEKSWGKEFNCASCHSPHGSYSDRLLNYNPNDMGATASQEGGNAATSKIYDFASIATIKADVATKLDADTNYNPKEDYGKYILVKGTLGDFGITPDSGDTATTPAITSYGFSLDHGVYSLTLANNPILDIHEYQSAPKKSNYASMLFKLDDPNTDANTNGIADELEGLVFPYDDGSATMAKTYDQNDAKTVMNIHFQKGYITGSAVTDANYGQVARAYVVKLDLVAYSDATYASPSQFAAGGQFSYVSAQNVQTTPFGSYKPTFSYDKSLYNSKLHDGSAWKNNGIAMNNYCAACHTDYLATSEKSTGTFTKAYRHTTEVDTYTCVRCHYAHGTSREMMKDSQGRTMADLTDATYMGANVMTADQAAAWLDDKNSSSALKKFTNMSGCWSCHNSSHNEQLVNNMDTTPAQQAINGGWKNE